MFTAVFVALALSTSALANVFVTSPVASSTFTGGQSASIGWEDDGNQPTLQAFGPSMVSIYAGNAQQQTQLQLIVASVDVSTTQSITFTPNPSIGPNGNEYFVRFESLSLKDATSPQYPALAFSAKFTLAGMTGTFNSSVQAQIDGQSTAPIGSPTPAAPASAGGSTPAPTPAPSASTSASKAPSLSSASSSAKASTTANSDAANGASTLIATSGVAVAVAAAAVLGNMFF